MNINIKVFKSTKGGSFVGFGSVTLDNFINIKYGISSGNYGLRVLWPFDKFTVNNETKYDNKVWFVNDEDRKVVESNIIKEYNKVAGITNNSTKSNINFNNDVVEDFESKEDEEAIDDNNIPDINGETSNQLKNSAQNIVGGIGDNISSQAQAQATLMAPAAAQLFGRARQATANDLILLTALYIAFTSSGIFLFSIILYYILIFKCRSFPAVMQFDLPRSLHGLEPHLFLPSLCKRARIELALLLKLTGRTRTCMINHDSRHDAN